jgi:hypothetical protein
MSATAIGMHDFIEALRLHIPPIHPCGEEAVSSCLCQMRDAIDNPAEVVRLAAKIRNRVVQELLFEAESAESAHCFKIAYRLRHQAERFRASHRYPPDDWWDEMFRLYSREGCRARRGGIGADYV